MPTGFSVPTSQKPAKTTDFRTLKQFTKPLSNLNNIETLSNYAT